MTAPPRPNRNGARAVTAALAMLGLVACSSLPSPAAPPHLSAAAASAFRADADTAYAVIQHCWGTGSAKVNRRYEPFTARLTAIETRAMGTPFHAILVAAKQRHDAIMAVSDCARFEDGPALDDLVAKELATAAQTLSRMERAVSSYSPEKG